MPIGEIGIQSKIITHKNVLNCGFGFDHFIVKYKVYIFCTSLICGTYFLCLNKISLDSLSGFKHILLPWAALLGHLYGCGLQVLLKFSHYSHKMTIWEKS